MHQPGEYGDNLTNFRTCISDIVKKQQACSFFETGVHGLFFRFVFPVRDGKELLGFLELGIKPHRLLHSTAAILDLRSYFFIDPSLNVGNETSMQLEGMHLCQECQDTFIQEAGAHISLTDHTIFTLQHRHYLSLIKPITDNNGALIGKVIFIQDIQTVYDDIFNALLTDIAVSLATLILIYVILSSYIGKILSGIRQVQMLLNNANDAIFLVRLEDGRILDANVRAQNMLQYSHDELLHMNVTDFRRPVAEQKFD